MTAFKPILIHTQLDNDVALLIECIDNIMKALPSDKLAFVSGCLRLKELPTNLSDIDPIEACKLAAILGLKVAQQVSDKKQQQAEAISASN